MKVKLQNTYIDLDRNEVKLSKKMINKFLDLLHDSGKEGYSPSFYITSLIVMNVMSSELLAQLPPEELGEYFKNLHNQTVKTKESVNKTEKLIKNKLLNYVASDEEKELLLNTNFSNDEIMNFLENKKRIEKDLVNKNITITQIIKNDVLKHEKYKAFQKELKKEEININEEQECESMENNDLNVVLEDETTSDENSKEEEITLDEDFVENKNEEDVEQKEELDFLTEQEEIQEDNQENDEEETDIDISKLLNGNEEEEKIVKNNKTNEKTSTEIQEEKVFQKPLYDIEFEDVEEGDDF